MKDKVGTPVIVAAVVVLAAILGFVGWKVLGPSSAGKSTASSTEYANKMQQMTQQQMQMRSNADQHRPGGSGSYPGGGPPGPGGPSGAAPGPGTQ